MFKNGANHMKIRLLTTLCILLSACSFTNHEKLEPLYIGFIGDYSKFERIETDDGLKSFRYASDRVLSGFYSKVIIDPVEFYPFEVTSEQLSAELFAKTKAYINESLAEVAALSLEVVEKPQAGALRLTPRISAIKISPGDVKIRELIPVGSLIALGKAAAGYRYENIDIYMEFKATDSMDGDFIGGSVKQGKAGEISGFNEVVTFEHIKPLLDIWIKDAKGVFEKLKQFNEKNRARLIERL